VDIEIRQRNPARVAARRYTGPFGEPLARFWRANVGPWLAAHEIIDCPRYGIALDDPATTPAERCRYDACVELPPGVSLSDATEHIISGGAYAITRFKGTGAGIGAAWGAFLDACAARGLEFDTQRVPFEHYPRGTIVDPRTHVFACELCLPVGS